VFSRRKSEPEPTDQPPAKEGGKGRPTPTRKEAEAAARARAKGAPKSRREQAMQERQTRVLKRDAGPVRAMVRDVVDQRLMLMEMLIPVLFVSLVLGWVGSGMGNDRLLVFANLVFYVVFLTLIVETVLLRLRVRRALRSRFPDESMRGLTFYAFNRAMLMRFLRNPKPTVKIGDPLKEHYR
jgi:Protein of unknown function (DUF3043)